MTKPTYEQLFAETIAAGSFYYQLKACLALGTNPTLPVNIPVCTYAFGQNSVTHYYEELPVATAEQQTIAMEQAQELVKSMREDAIGLAAGTAYIQSQMEQQMQMGTAWAHEQSLMPDPASV